MSLAAVVSAIPCLDFEDKPEIEPLRSWHRDLNGPEGWRAWWIVPTSRRRRQIIGQLSAAARLPRVLTLDGLIQQLQGFARIQLRPIGNTGRLLRVARAWNQVNPNGSLTSGRVLQLDRIASEWREGGEAAPASAVHAKFLRAFDKIIEKDRCLDRPAALTALAKEIADARSPLATLLAGKRIYFDGYHRFSKTELALIEALAKHADVRLWLVGAEDQAYHENVAHVLERLRIKPIRDARSTASPLSVFGRSIFTDHATPCDKVAIIAAATMEAECHAIAVKIKSLMRKWGAAGRLSEIAVVVPDDSYLPLLKSSFHAAQIDYSPGAEVFALEESRPARILLLALRLIRHGWPAETLFDFLRQSLIFRKLTNHYLLEWLRQRSPQAIARNDWKTWKETWNQSIANHEKAIAIDEDERDDDPADRAERASALAAQLRALVDSIDEVLSPVEKLEKELARKAANAPAALVAAIAQLLESIQIANWLSPAGRDWTLIPEREWEIDQLAFNNLKDVLVELYDAPADDFLRDAEGNIDVELVLKLAMAAETFQTSAEDDAGVQILRPRTIRGSRFRAIFAVGMVEGKVPPDPDSRSAVNETESAVDRLCNQEKHEQEYLFSQLFESASEQIIMTRPMRDNDAPLMESPFLRRVRDKLGIKEPLRIPSTIVDVRQALLFAGRPEVSSDAAAQRMLAVRDIWNKRPEPDKLQIEHWALPLLALRYPKERAFSATALEKYASCPFHHFAAKTLGLDELERDDAAMRWGSFLHDVLDRFFKEQRPDDPTPVRDRFLTLLRKHWPTVAPTLDPTHLHDFETALTNAFVTVNAFLTNEGFTQVESEWEQKAIAIPDGNGGELLLHVKIDRIDWREKDNVEIICDFKTGNVPGGRKLMERIAAGRALQLPLYGYARWIETGVPVRHGIYVKLSRRVDGTPDAHGPFLVNVGEVLTMHARAVKIPFQPEEAGKRAVELASNMRKGLIPLSSFPADHKDPACQSYCSARHACRQPKGYKN